MPAYGLNTGAREQAGVLVQPRHREGDLKYLIDFCAVPANFAAGDFVSFGRIPSNAVIHWHLSRLTWDAPLTAGRFLQVGTNLTPAAIGVNIDATAVSGVAGVPVYTRPINTFGQNLWLLEGQARDNQLARDLRVQLTGGVGPAAIWNLGLYLVYS